MLSTPPAIMKSQSPARIARAAWPMASMPEPQRRLMVVPGTETGRPERSTAIRPTLRLSSPAWLAQPKIRSSTFVQSTDGFRSHQRLERNGGEVVGANRGERARHSGRSGVRIASQIKASVICGAPPEFGCVAETLADRSVNV